MLDYQFSPLFSLKIYDGNSRIGRRYHSWSQSGKGGEMRLTLVVGEECVDSLNYFRLIIPFLRTFMAQLNRLTIGTRTFAMEHIVQI